MKKKFVVYIGIGIIIISSLVTLIALSGKGNKTHTYKVYTKILDKIEKKDSFLVYFRNDYPYKCNTCESVDVIIDFYKNTYGLKFIVFDTVYSRDLVQVDLDFELAPDFIKNPAVLIVENGKWKTIVNEIYNEQPLKEALIKYKFIDEKYASIETEITDDNVFNQIFKDGKKHLIVVNSEKSMDIKKMLYNMSVNDYYFQYYSISKGIFANYDSFMTLSDLIHDDINYTTLVVIKNEKVVDSISSFNQTKIRSFLKKNGIIK